MTRGCNIKQSDQDELSVKAKINVSLGTCSWLHKWCTVPLQFGILLPYQLWSLIENNELDMVLELGGFFGLTVKLNNAPATYDVLSDWIGLTRHSLRCSLTKVTPDYRHVKKYPTLMPFKEHFCSYLTLCLDWSTLWFVSLKYVFLTAHGCRWSPDHRLQRNTHCHTQVMGIPPKVN